VEGGLDVGGLDVGGLDVGGLDVGGLDVGGLDVGGLDVGGLDVGGLDVGGLDVGGLGGAIRKVSLNSEDGTSVPLNSVAFRGHAAANRRAAIARRIRILLLSPRKTFRPTTSSPALSSFSTHHCCHIFVMLDNSGRMIAKVCRVPCGKRATVFRVP